MLNIFAICTGACLGTLSRWGLGLWLSAGASMPWGTLAANLIGGYLIGVFIALFQAMPQLDPAWKLAIITGFLGALTTFSSYSAEVIGLLQQQRLAAALGWAGVHLVGSLFMTYMGMLSWSIGFSR